MISTGTIEALRQRLGTARAAGHAIGFVPTMGALHEGHARLIEIARQECDRVVVSIFVNPLQFDRADDLARYPRTLDADLATCSRLGVDDVFVPEAGQMYPSPPACMIDVGHLGDHLCGRFRPSHFRGVATVVMKLLQIVQPQRAYFGRKDAQQLAIIQRMVRDLDVPVAITGVETVREPDGLALSSRNRLLSESQRATAPVLIAALRDADRLVAGGHRDAQAVVRAASALIPAGAEIRLEYLELVDPEALQPVTSIDGPVLAAGAIWLGSTRLIDNLLCTPPRRQ
jgi:pantoate--beta-alanine ligase